MSRTNPASVLPVDPILAWVKFIENNKFCNYNYNKGNYESFREHFNFDWEVECHKLNVNEIWELLKKKIKKGVDRFIPTVVPVKLGKYDKYKTPLSEGLRSEIKNKHKMWKKYIEDKKDSSFNAYKRQRNKVKSVVRKDYRNFQNNIAKECKINPTKFWKHVNSKIKSKDKIGDLNYTDSNGKLSK